MSSARKLIAEKVRTALIVESSPAYASALAAHCQRMQLEPIVCNGIGQALDKIPILPRIACIAIGSTLADGEGINLVYSLRSLPQLAATPILFISAEDDAALARNALIAGATEVCNQAMPQCMESALTAIGSEPQISRCSGRALVIEDDPVFARLIASVCDKLGIAVDLADSVNKALARLRKRPYQMVVSDVILTGRETGIDMVRRIRQMPGEVARTPILVTSSHNDTARRLEILRSGADDYLPKPFLAEELFWRLRNLLGHTDIAPSSLPAASEPANDGMHLAGSAHGTLTARETEIAQAVSQGLSDKEIALKLDISFWTVRSHINRIFSKLDLFNRASLVKYMLQHQPANSGHDGSAPLRAKPPGS